MANTVIQIKRSTTTVAPSAGSLSAAEPAYSYLSDKLFIGSSDGSQVIEIGGRYYVDATIAAFGQANLANSIAIAAYDKANAANLLAYNTGIGTNTYLLSVIAGANAAVGAGANAYATAVGAGANAYMISVQNGSNTAVGAGANAYADSVGSGSNNYLLAVIAGANTAVGAGANAYSLSLSDIAGDAANSYADATFVKLVNNYQSITGNLAITGSLTVSGNTYVIDAETLRVNDPLIYLAGNNYSSDIVDIGFIANYVNATGQNVHTGLYREHVNKEYYLFQGYDAEPINNHIGALSNNMTLAVLNADIKTSNLTLGGANAILTIASVGVAANAFAAATIAGANTAVGAGANAYATAVGAGANAYMIAVQNGSNTAVGAGANAYATAVGAGSNNYLLAVIAGANTAVGAGANAYALSIVGSAGAGSNAYADLVGAAANTNASNASYLSTGTVPSARISGSYTGITGVGILTAGIWNGSTITVPYGGTGVTSFTTNGVLYGNSAGSLKVTSAGTEGQVLQASAAGVPQFGMLDGGTF